MSLEPGAEKTVKVRSPVMAKNDEIAAENQQLLDALGVLGVNIMSSPGSGKTTLLEAMAGRLGESMAVIEGDVQTRRDAERIERAGCLAYQIETRGACHLDAHGVAVALRELNLVRGRHKLLIIENVGNLICPSSYHLGEHLRVALLSVPEGDDKVLKYPSLFSRVSVVVINKIDLLPYLKFDVDRALTECRSLNPNIQTFQVSALTGQGVDEFCDFLLARASAAQS